MSFLSFTAAPFIYQTINSIFPVFHLNLFDKKVLQGTALGIWHEPKCNTQNQQNLLHENK